MISIVIPVYKAEKYIGTCIKSVIAQTYGDWELLLIDDGSPDSSGAICDQYAAGDKRIHVFHIPNGGVSRARNFGINNAKGRWLTFIDSDDRIDSEYLADFINHNPTPRSLIISGLITQDPKRTYTSYKYDDESTSTGTSAAELIAKYDLFRDGGPVNKLFDLHLIRQNGLHFPTDLSYHEDHIFVYSYYLLIDTIILSRHCGYYYMRYGIDSNNSLSNLGKRGVGSLFRASDIFLELVPKLFDYYKIDNSDYRNKVISRTGYSQRVLALYNLYLNSTLSSHECKKVLKEEHDKIVCIRHCYYKPSLKRSLFLIVLSMPVSLSHSILSIFHKSSE